MSNEKIFILAFFGLLSILGLWGVIVSIFDSNNKMTTEERKKHQKQKQEKLKKEYEEKKALSVQKAEEKRKENEQLKENKKKAKKELIEKSKIEKEKLAENERIAKEEKKIKSKEKKLNFFNWFKPNFTIKSGIVTPKRNTVERPVNSLFGSENKEPNPNNDKMEELLKEIRDL